MATVTKKQLEELGLSEKEARVYLALLELGSVPVRDVVKQAKIKRPTAYVVLDSLLERGLINMIDRRGVRIYNSAPPKKLIEYLKIKSDEYSGLADTAKKLLPGLKSLQKKQKEETVKPKVEVFEGSREMKSVYEDTLASLEAIRAYAYLNDEGKEKAKKDIKVQVVLPDSIKERKQIAQSKEQAFSPEINVYDNKVVLVSPAEEFALVIESQELASAFKKVFGFSGGRAGKISKKFAR